MELRTLMVTMEMTILAIFAAYMFGYIYANAEGTDYHIDYYKTDLAILTSTMLSNDNEASVTYPMKEGYFLGIENDNKLCVWYQKYETGLKSKLASFYRGVKGKINKKCESLVENKEYSLSVKANPANGMKEINYVLTKVKK